MHKENIAVDAEHNEGTVVYVSCDGAYAGCIVISDVIKDNSKKAISSLPIKLNGLKNCLVKNHLKRSLLL